jgi:hypothetical protein
MSKLVHRRIARVFGRDDGRLRNRVVATRSEWMTAKDSSCREPAASERAVLLECLDRICRTTRHISTARWQHRRQRDLIPADEQNEERAHESIYCGELWCDSRCFPYDRRRDAGELVESEPVCRRPHMNDHVHCSDLGNDRRACELAQSPLEQITLDRRSPMLRYHEPDTWVAETRKGSAHPNVEMFGAKSLPCSRDLTQLGATRDTMTARKRG